ncbi:hypothetical protein [Rhodobacter lacus]|uniref:Uncharacterized protein n=1 Tax=Rhodobacter lacus TaxID=1641972 RepID=A0ABW5ABX6_9RHOB
MKRAFVLVVLAGLIGGSAAYADVKKCPPGQSVAPSGQCECDDPNTVKKDDGKCGPIITLPNGDLPVNQATNLVFFAPLGALAIAALAGSGGGGGAANSTTP